MMEKKGEKILIHASTWFAPILIPLIIFFISQHDEVKSLSIQALIFHIAMTLLITISFVFSFLLIGIPFFIIFSLVSIIVPIMGIINAAQNKEFKYPFIGSFIK